MGKPYISRFLNMKRSYLGICISCCLPFHVSAASVSGTTLQSIKGHEPVLRNLTLNDLNVFGYTTEQDGTKYFENKQIDGTVKFSSFGAVLREALTSDEYEDEDGDSDVIVKVDDSGSLSTVWAYLDEQTGQYTEFTPSSTDDFCSLSTSLSSNTYRLTISGPIVLETTYGDPKKTTYQSYDDNGVSKVPQKQYTITIDDSNCSSVDYDKIIIGLLTKARQYNRYNQLTDSGFTINNKNGAEGNYPTTGFKQATFRLRTWTGKNGSDYPLANNSSGWTFTTRNDKNLDLISITSNGTFSFNGTDAGNPEKIFNALPITVTIEGQHATKGNLHYTFTINKWYVFTQTTKSNLSSATTTCSALGGDYRLPSVREVVNSPYGRQGPPYALSYAFNDSDVEFGYQIGDGLMAEWGTWFETTAAFPGGYSKLGFSGYIWTNETQEVDGELWSVIVGTGSTELGKIHVVESTNGGTPICISNN